MTYEIRELELRLQELEFERVNFCPSDLDEIYDLELELLDTQVSLVNAKIKVFGLE